MLIFVSIRSLFHKPIVNNNNNNSILSFHSYNLHIYLHSIKKEVSSKMTEDDECPTLISAKVPVTILTGFLGSGKTTLLHYVLTAEHQLHIAVIVNEFEFGKTIEKGLTVKSSEKDDDEWVELKNGCMCCSSQSQTIKALENLIQTKGTFDLILIETAGLADPGPVAGLFWQEEALCGNIFLSGIITVVDGVNIFRYLNDSEVCREATRQILIADKILLNKCDLLEEEKRCQVRGAIEKLNPSAEIMETEFSRVSNLRDLLFMSTTRSLPPSLMAHVHGEDAVHSTHESGAVPRSMKITALPLEFFSSTTTLAARTIKGVEEIVKEILYAESFQSGEEKEEKDVSLSANGACSSNTLKAHSGNHYKSHVRVEEDSSSSAPRTNDEPPFEVIRCKAAIWVYEPLSSSSAPAGVIDNVPEVHSSSFSSSSSVESGTSTAQYQLYQLQCIGELFSIQRMEGESVPFGCSRALILGRNLSEEKMRNIFLKYLTATP